MKLCLFEFFHFTVISFWLLFLFSLSPFFFTDIFGSSFRPIYCMLLYIEHGFYFTELKQAHTVPSGSLQRIFVKQCRAGHQRQ